MSKTVKIIRGVYGSNESQVVIGDGDKDGRRIVIHPWRKGVSDRNSSSVFVAAGTLTKKGFEKQNKDGEEDYTNAIFDRDDFVEGLLAVFPELTRA